MWMDGDGGGSMWMDVDGCGWMWLDVDGWTRGVHGSRWMQMGANRCGCGWVCR